MLHKVREHIFFKIQRKHILFLLLLLSFFLLFFIDGVNFRQQLLNDSSFLEIISNFNFYKINIDLWVSLFSSVLAVIGTWYFTFTLTTKEMQANKDNSKREVNKLNSESLFNAMNEYNNLVQVIKVNAIYQYINEALVSMVDIKNALDEIKKFLIKIKIDFSYDQNLSNIIDQEIQYLDHLLDFFIKGTFDDPRIPAYIEETLYFILDEKQILDLLEYDPITLKFFGTYSSTLNITLQYEMINNLINLLRAKIIDEKQFIKYIEDIKRSPNLDVSIDNIVKENSFTYSLQNLQASSTLTLELVRENTTVIKNKFYCINFELVDGYFKIEGVSINDKNIYDNKNVISDLNAFCLGVDNIDKTKYHQNNVSSQIHYI